jgi:hypothetical protein
LRHGGRLYIGELDEEALTRVDEVENFLIYTYGHEMNTKVEAPARVIYIEHMGEVPASISSAKEP